MQMDPAHAMLSIVGIDFGAAFSRLCVSKNGTDHIELHVNRVSNRQTPTLVSFDKRVRY